MQHDANYAHKARVSYTTEAWNFTRWITDMGLHSKFNDILLKIDIAACFCFSVPPLLKFPGTRKKMIGIIAPIKTRAEEQHGFLKKLLSDSIQPRLRR